METLKGYFTDFDQYNETVKNWDLNYKLLSKSDFSAELHMIFDDNFSLLNEKLIGKIEQKGKTEKGLMVFGILAKNCTLYWFDKKIGSDTLVIFPKENNYEVISDSNHDAYVLSINKNIFFDVMKKAGIKKDEKIFNNKAQLLVLNKEFSSRFINLLEYYLNTNLNNPKKNSALIESITLSLVEYFGKAKLKKVPIKLNKKDLAIKKAVKLIDKQVDNLFSIPQICALVGVSESTLLIAFKEKYQVSPSDYIKAFRLNKVKQEIYNTKTITISEIAGKYHFWHMGQFAKDFKKQFGILPSEVRKKKQNVNYLLK